MATLHRLTPSELLNQVPSLEFMRAFMECSDELREHALEMLEAMGDPDADATEREFAAITLADLLYPNTHEGDKRLGIDLTEAEKLARDPANMHAAESGSIAALDAMDAEEATFAERLVAVMKERNLTQTALAEKVCLHQSAISMMLSRQCRPQKRTVAKLAAALGVKPGELWPAHSGR